MIDWVENQSRGIEARRVRSLVAAGVVVPGRVRKQGICPICPPAAKLDGSLRN